MYVDADGKESKKGLLILAYWTHASFLSLLCVVFFHDCDSVSIRREVTLRSDQKNTKREVKEKESQPRCLRIASVNHRVSVCQPSGVLLGHLLCGKARGEEKKDRKLKTYFATDSPLLPELVSDSPDHHWP